MRIFNNEIYSKKRGRAKRQKSAFLNKFDYYYALSKDDEAAKDIRLGGFSDYIIKTVAKLVYQHDKIISNHMKLCAAENSVRALLNFIRDSVAWIYLVYIVSSGQISISDFVFYFGIVTGFSNWVIRLTWSYNSIEKCLIDCKRYREYTESRSENDEKPDVDFDSVERIEFKNVTFAYPEAQNSTIKDMNFKIRKGENIAVVGENGAGKTTAVKLLCGLYFPSEGNILINGKSSRDFNSKSYFKLFSALFQDYYFMPMTVQQNITASLDCDKEKLYSAFEKAGILDKINSLKDKENSLMNKEVYKQAIDFSGGEKQKTAARQGDLQKCADTDT
ncbi:MAG: ABC transporter ATP-binding protein/permease [Clostridiales bacterium]|nr:ABC transporter ATP-binding protein/permease [Clostridiales bacterium]